MREDKEKDQGRKEGQLKKIREKHKRCVQGKSNFTENVKRKDEVEQPRIEKLQIILSDQQHKMAQRDYCTSSGKSPLICH